MNDMVGVGISPRGFSALPGGDAKAGTVVAEVANTLSYAAIDSASMLAEMGRMLNAAAIKSSTGATAPQGAEAIVNSSGAPAIDGVTINFSPEDMAAALQVLQGKTQEAQLKTAKEGIEASKTKMQNNHEKTIAKLDDWIKKSADAAAKEKAMGIFGWISKAFAFVAAAVAVVAAAVVTAGSFGAGAPLLALAVVGLVGATISLASGISQAAGGPALELSSLMSKMCTSMLEGLGVPKDKAEAAGKIMAGALALAVCPASMMVDPQLFGNMFGGIAELIDNDPTKSAIVSAVFTVLATIAIAVVSIAVSGGSQTASVVASVAQGLGGLVSGAMTATTGGLGIAKSFDEHAASSALVDKKKFDAMLVKLQQQMEENQEEIKKVVQQMQDGIMVVSQMIASASESRAQISANLGRAMA